MPDKNSATIFLVDDDPMFREMLRDKLIANNNTYEICEFSTGEQCLRSMDLNPDVVILDYHLDNLQKDAANGMEILKTIKEENENLPVIILSSQAKYGVAMDLIIKGAYYYIRKDEESAFDETNKLINEVLGF